MANGTVGSASLEKFALKAVSCALALVLALSLSPISTAFADEVFQTASDAVRQAESTDQESGLDAPADAVEAETEREAGYEASGIAAPSEEEGGQGGAISPEDVYAVEFVPVKNTTSVTVAVPGAAELASAETVDTIVVEATMSHGGKTTREVSAESDLAVLAAAGGSFSVDFGDFGAFSAVVRFCNGEQVVHETSVQTVGVTADTYNISPVSATLPVTMFSLNLWGEGSIRESGPVILLMERPSSYDWDAMPGPEDGAYGMYGLPYFTKDEISYQPADFRAAADLFCERVSTMADYVGDLMELDPTSHVNLYCVDGYVDLVQSIIYANGIPEDQYTITVMSDGTFTYEQFASAYGSEQPAQQHEALVAQWEAAKKYAYQNGRVADGYGPWQACNQFWAAVDSEPNAQLWVARKDLLVSPSDENAFGLSVQGSSKVVQVSIASLLQTNIQSNAANQEAFKALYNFNDSYFSAAEEQGKKVMLFLGTRVDVEQNFSDYARFVMSYYGDEYAYYYKGHPATPTDMHPSKVTELDSLGVTDVDSSVAAELILFFNPEIYLSGYGSSTYASVPEGMAKGMFAMTKEQGLANPQYQNMDYWMSKVDPNGSTSVAAECVAGHETFLVEFSDAVSAAAGYDIALWDSTSATIRYYQYASDGSLLFVSQQEGMAGARPVAEGTYAIMASCASGKVLDVAGGSLFNCANVQLYGYNGTSAQQWNVSYDESGLATITNVGSGKVLDVTSGQAVSGANVQQYESNGTLAQKWSIEQRSGDTVVIRSALDGGITLDIASAGTSNGTNVQVWEANGTVAQAFEFLPVYPSVSVEGQANLDGTYRILSAVDTDYAIDVADWSQQDGGRLQVWQSAGTENQEFRIERLDNGYYSITSAWSHKTFDVTDGSIVPGTPVQQWDRSANAANQQWRIVEGTGGMYTFQNVKTGLMLDLAGGMAYNGRGLDVYTPNGTQAQRWLLVPVD